MMAGRALRYLTSRICYKKNTKNLRQTDVRLVTNYTNVVDLTSVSVAYCLAIGSLVVTGQVAKYIAGPGVIISVIIASTISLLLTIVYGELRSRVPRVQQGTCYFLLYTSSDIASFTSAWIDLITSILQTAIITRAISSNIDSLAGGYIRYLTSTHVGDINLVFDEKANLDFVAFFLVLLMMLYIAVGGYHRFSKFTVFYTASNCTVIALLLFAGIVAAFHFDFKLWTKFFDQGYHGIMQGAAIILPVLLTQKSLLTSCDFMWLGIRPTVLASITMVAVTSFMSLLGSSALMTLLSDPYSWNSDATMSAAFQARGTKWINYVISPLVIMTLTPFSLLTMLKAINTLCMMTQGPMQIPSIKYYDSDKPPSLYVVLFIGVLTSLLALLLSMTFSLQISAVCVLLEGFTICSIIVALRNKPQDYNDAVNNNQQKQTNQQRSSTTRNDEMQRNNERPETSNLIQNAEQNIENNSGVCSDSENCSNKNKFPKGDNTPRYGALPSTVTNSNQPHSSHDNADEQLSEEDVDEAVEEFRLQLANQCYQGSLSSVFHSKPSQETYKSSKIATVCLTFFMLVFVLATWRIVHLYNGDANSRNQSINRFSIAVIVLMIIGSILSFAVIFVLPADQVLPRTFLLRIPAMPWTPVATMLLMCLLLSAINYYAWVAAVLLLLLGSLCYFLRIYCEYRKQSRDQALQQRLQYFSRVTASNSCFVADEDDNTSSRDHHGNNSNIDFEDYHQMATFSTGSDRVWSSSNFLEEFHEDASGAKSSSNSSRGVHDENMMIA